MTRFGVLDDGHGAIIAGSIDGSQGTDAVLTTSDGAASLTVNGTGDFTVSFGAAFTAAPIVVATIDSTVVATEGITVQVVASAATDVQFNTVTIDGTTVAAAAADHDFSFIAIGKRNR